MATRCLNASLYDIFNRERELLEWTHARLCWFARRLRDFM